jgi:ferredoxin-type protein NapH
MQRHLNKLRWASLWTVFAMLVILPLVSIYQIYVATHGYRLLSPPGKFLYNVMYFLTSPFTDDPATTLGAIKGTTWSGSFFGLKISDPLAAIGQVAASLDPHWPFLVTALIPIVFTIIFGRFFCGWICPATLLYELNTNVAIWLQKIGLPTGKLHFDRRLKYGVLALGLVLSAISGSVLVANIYPPAIVGRELYYVIALGGFGTGTIFFILTLLFDILVARRGFCRYLCPGGAVYSLLGHYRLFRIKRTVKTCNDCAKCNAICEFALDPMRDDFGQECNNCSACIAVCPTDALSFTTNIRDIPYQGPGHLGHQFLKSGLSDQSGKAA